MKTDRLPIWLMDVLLAGTLLSRLPLPRVPEDSFARMAKAVWAYPIVGTVLAVIAGSFALLLLGLGVPAPFAAGGLLAALMLLTGAMHEDGLADSADGFWGGYEAARRLEIMKDSHLGTYGLLALLMVTGLRWSAYALLLPLGLAPVIAAASLSRGVMPGVMATLPHARETGLSRSVGRPETTTAIWGLGLSLAIAGICVGAVAVLCLIVALGVALALGALAKAKIAGQTGDVLGTTQQLSEVAILAVLLVHLT
ncbi:adenosylcobinamide-GDP ribazoletransferase [Roseobacter sp. YSTF-M11]|uniref:Adenosylcobinamide-GDP ribazoletransferase n=1 Tax=Roseobacter insulae TaxID=2859783 RepID=A0A9X1FVA6_9RHOB|nr:adenosylcobinamide-GDP ribazoletransferase [Roseobacter insulae]MBW4707785.1 adenosylcobinamide-GDP ribazoletransferase [Roseobacter insulae]